MKYFNQMLVIAMTMSSVACSTTGRFEAVRPEISNIVVKYRNSGSVFVQVLGKDGGVVPTDIFKQALIDSIKSTSIFDEVLISDGAQYVLQIVILDKRHSQFGDTHWTYAEWRLMDSKGNEIWMRTFRGDGNSNEFSGASRFRNSAEKSFRALISTGLTALSELNLLALPQK